MGTRESSAVPTRIGADIGGTFTDVAAVDALGTLRIGKRLTMHGAEDEGVVAAIGDTGIEFTGARTILAHGHTLVINSLLERKGARVGLLTTEGFADVIDMGRGSRPEIFNLRYRRDPVLVQRRMVFELAERVFADGTIARSPSDEELESLVEKLRQARVEAVAIAFLNSYVEPANERAVGRYLQSALPDVTVSLSSDLSRQWREFERFTTAVANAYVAPVADRYVHRLLRGIGAQGFRGEFVVLDSNGGALGVEGARRFPVRTVESGPVAGVLAARDLAHRLAADKVVTFDMGGTTAKSCLIEDGTFASTELYWIGGYDRGFPLQVHSVDVTEVGAGGGSIAWMDEAGRLRVGPRSAGSRPGPASYGLGGIEPTVTDANLYCGRLDKANFIGSLKLDAEAAAGAIEELATKLNMAAQRLALGILKLANVSMAAAVRRQTLERGHDPRDFSLVAFGGAGPMHACEVAAEVGIRQVVVPLFPGHFSAIGMLGANLRLDRREILRGSLDALDANRLRSALQRIAGELENELSFGDQADVGAPVFSWSLALRYHGQDHTLLIQSPETGATVPDDLAAVFKQRYDVEYLRRYGHLDDQAEIEVAALEVVGERHMPRVTIREGRASSGPSSNIQSYFGLSDEAVSSEVIARGSLAEGDRFAGPVVIYEEGATTVVPPGATGCVGSGGNLLIDTSELIL